MAVSGRVNGDAALLSCLVTGMSLKDAAAVAGISDRTARRRMKDEGFRSELRLAQAQLMDQTVAPLTRSATEAAQVLRGLLEGDASPSTRLAAAKAVLDQQMRYWEAVELEDRLSALEARLR